MLGAMGWVLAIGIVAACGALVYLGYVIEPHWVAKDGRRFLTTAQGVDRHGSNVGRRHEVRGHLLDDGTILLARRRFLRTRRAIFRLRAKQPEATRRRQQYVLEPLTVDPTGERLLLRLPLDSRLTAALDALVGAPDRSAEDP